MHSIGVSDVDGGLCGGVVVIIVALCFSFFLGVERDFGNCHVEIILSENTIHSKTLTSGGGPCLHFPPDAWLLMRKMKT